MHFYFFFNIKSIDLADEKFVKNITLIKFYKRKFLIGFRKNIDSYSIAQDPFHCLSASFPAIFYCHGEPINNYTTMDYCLQGGA
jgi:hypothetical protein